MTLLLTLDDGSIQRKLADAVDFARAAVLEGAQVGAHVGANREDAVTLSHLFEAEVPGYRGWRWSVTIALAGEDEPVTVSEVVLVPGPEARIAPAWVPWEQRVRAGDLGVGDIFPTDKDDPRLAPAYLQSDDPAVEEVALEAGLGRVHVLSRFGREDAATRWHEGEFGPRSDMARSAPDVCGTCGFFVPLAGSLRGTFGACTNDIAPADGHVVDVAYGCGAHSEIEVEVTSSVPVAELVYDDSLLDYAQAPEAPAVEETAVAEEAAVVEEAPVDEEAPVVEEAPVAEEAPAVVEETVAVEEAPAVADVPVEEAVIDTPAAEPETAVGEAEVAPAEVEPEVAEAEAPEAVVPEPEPESAEVEAPAEPEAAEAEVAEPEIAEVPEVEEAVAAPEPVAEVEPEAVAEVEPEVVVEIVVEPVVDEQAEVETAVADEPVEAEVPEAVTEAAVETETAEAGEATGDSRDA